MKKGFFLLAALLCVTFLLIGCGGGPGGSNPGDNTGVSDSLNAQLNARSQAASSLQQVAKNAEQAGQEKMQQTPPPGPSGMVAAFGNILAAEGEEPEGEEPGGTHGPKWTGPDADGWYSITGRMSGLFEDHVLKIQMKLPDDSTTMYKVEDTTTAKDGSPIGVGSEETTYVKGADGLVSGTSTYIRYYRFPNAENGRMTDYKAIATQSFSNFSPNGTGHYETTLNLISTYYPAQGGTIINDRKYKEILDINFNLDRTKLHASGTIQDVTTPGAEGPASPYEDDWELITGAN